MDNQKCVYFIDAYTHHFTAMIHLFFEGVSILRPPKHTHTKQTNKGWRADLYQYKISDRNSCQHCPFWKHDAICIYGYPVSKINEYVVNCLCISYICVDYIIWNTYLPKLHLLNDVLLRRSRYTFGHCQSAVSFDGMSITDNGELTTCHITPSSLVKLERCNYAACQNTASIRPTAWLSLNLHLLRSGHMVITMDIVILSLWGEYLFMSYNVYGGFNFTAGHG